MFVSPVVSGTVALSTTSLTIALSAICGVLEVSATLGEEVGSETFAGFGVDTFEVFFFP